MGIDIEIEGHLIKLNGSIDEYSVDALHSLTEMTSGDITLDLGRITSINSCGVLGFYKFVKRLREDGASISYINMPIVVARQFNYVPQLANEGIVASVFVHLQCLDCCTFKDVLVTPEAFRTIFLGDEEPKILCDSCSEPIEPTDDLDLFTVILGLDKKEG